MLTYLSVSVRVTAQIHQTGPVRAVRECNREQRPIMAVNAPFVRVGGPTSSSRSRALDTGFSDVNSTQRPGLWATNHSGECQRWGCAMTQPAYPAARTAALRAARRGWRRWRRWRERVARRIHERRHRRDFPRGWRRRVHFNASTQSCDQLVVASPKRSSGSSGISVREARPASSKTMKSI